MGIGEWYLRRGRITRLMWWVHYGVVITALSFLAGVADASLGYPAFSTPVEPVGVHDYVGGPLSLFVLLFTLVPWISSTVARLHDRGHSAWWLLWFLLPIVGWIVLFVQNGFLRGDAGPNRYGPAPGRAVMSPIDA